MSINDPPNFGFNYNNRVKQLLHQFKSDFIEECQKSKQIVLFPGNDYIQNENDYKIFHVMSAFAYLSVDKIQEFQHFVKQKCQKYREELEHQYDIVGTIKITNITSYSYRLFDDDDNDITYFCLKIDFIN